MTHHHAGAPVGLELLGALLLVAGCAYVVAARRLERIAAGWPCSDRTGGGPPCCDPGRRTAWPRVRTVRWCLGVGAAVVGLAVVTVGHDPRAPVAGHLLLGMVAPLLLVTAAPVTLALRTLPRSQARVLGRALASRPVAVVSHPATAALLDVGGLWLMYRTDLVDALPPALVHLHMLLAGYLFAFALVGRDPAPHRATLVTRAAVLVAAVAAHDVLAKLLYADGAEAAGLLLHYGGTPVHVALFVLLGREWAARERRVMHRRRAARSPGPQRRPRRRVLAARPRARA